MVISATDQPVGVEAMLENKDIGFVRSWQAVEIKVETFTKYDVVHGAVVSIPNTPPRTRSWGWSIARIQLEEKKIQVGDKEVELSPGMAVRTEVKTDKRKVIDYFLSSFKEYQNESFSEC